MFTLKICGITTPDDARMVAASGADAVGLNFYPKSPRFVSDDQAQVIVAVLPPGMVKVGLFVNAEPAAICETMDALGLDLVQLHGDEPSEMLVQLSGRPVIKAFRVGPEGLAPVLAYLDRCRSLGCMPQQVLLDAMAAGAYGGTGQVTDWSAVRQYVATPGLPPVVLAGGLTAANVAEAIRATGARAVDTASGVESSPGRKDAAAVAAFVRAARGAGVLKRGAGC